jgi:hypothetical protein
LCPGTGGSEGPREAPPRASVRVSGTCGALPEAPGTHVHVSTVLKECLARLGGIGGPPPFGGGPPDRGAAKNKKNKNTCKIQPSYKKGTSKRTSVGVHRTSDGVIRLQKKSKRAAHSGRARQKAGWARELVHAKPQATDPVLAVFDVGRRRLCRVDGCNPAFLQSDPAGVPSALRQVRNAPQTGVEVGAADRENPPDAVTFLVAAALLAPCVFARCMLTAMGVRKARSQVPHKNLSGSSFSIAVGGQLSLGIDAMTSCARHGSARTR